MKLRYKKADLILWILAALVILVLMVLHPRFHYVLMFIYSFYKCIQAANRKNADVQSTVIEDAGEEHETKEIKKSRKEEKFRNSKSDEEEMQFTPDEMQFYSAFWHLIGMIFIGVLIGKSGLGWWWHAPYEYKADIRELKADTSDGRYAYFPDELPQGAKNVHWICRPGMMQGTSAKMLYFNADAEYVQEIRERYEDTAIIYTYKRDDELDMGYFVTKEGDFLGDDSFLRTLSEEQCERSIIYVTYLTEGNHGRCGGIFINPEDNFVYYFFV